MAPLRFGVLGVVLLGAAVAAACGDSSQSTFPDGTSSGASSGYVGGGDQDGSLFGDGGDPFGEGGVKVDALVFDPPTQAITVDGVTPGKASFTLKATKDGKTFDVTPQSIQFDRPDLAKAQIGAPVVLTAPGQYAGTGTLHG